MVPYLKTFRGPLFASLRSFIFRSANLSTLIRPPFVATHNFLGLSSTASHFYSEAGHSIFQPRLFPILAASACALALCEQSFLEAPLPSVNWPTLLQELRAAQHSHSLQSGFTAIRRPLNETTNAWSFQLTFPLSEKADIYALLTTLATALVADPAQSPRLHVDDSPTRSVLTVSHDSFTVQVSVPRLESFDRTVVIELLRTGADSNFSEGEVDALVRAYAIGQKSPRHEGQLLDGRSAVEGGARTSMDRGSQRKLHDAHQYEYEDTRPRAWEKLTDMGVEVSEGDSFQLTWDALAGYAEVKKIIDDTLVLPLRHPHVYDSIARGTRQRFESNLPKAILYEGPPGCGKTLSAKILAASIGVPFVHVPLETILSKYYGETTRKLAEILAAANDLGTCVVFIDECDSIGLSRDSQTEIHEVTRRTLSVLLRHIDGMDGPQNSILLAATNHKEDIDAALMSRFDVVVSFPLPDAETRTAILTLYAKHLSQDELNSISALTDGFSGREILDACEEAERTHGGAVVRQNADNTNIDVGLPKVERYIQAVRRKAPHIVGRTNRELELERQKKIRARIGSPSASLAT